LIVDGALVHAVQVQVHVLAIAQFMSMFIALLLQEYMDNLIVETLTLNEEESLAAEVKILDSMSEDSMPDNVVRSKVRGAGLLTLHDHVY
jgi:hypothetical protein